MRSLCACVVLLCCNTLSHSQNVLLPIHKQGHFGYINLAGQVVIEPTLDKAEPFTEDTFSIAYKKGIPGIVDSTGNILWCKHAKQLSLLNQNTVAVKQENNAWTISAFDSVFRPLIDTLAPFDSVTKINPHMALVARKQKVGLFNTATQKILIAPTYDSLIVKHSCILGFLGQKTHFHNLWGDHYAVLTSAQEYNLSWWPIVGLVQQNGAVQLMHLQYETTSPSFNGTIRRLNDSLFICQNKSQFYLYNAHCGVHFPVKASWQIYPYNKHYLVQSHAYFGLLSPIGDTVLPFKYFEVRINNDWILSRTSNGWGLHDASGAVILPNKFNLIYEVADQNLLHMVHKGYHGIATSKGKMLVPCEYDEIQTLPNLIKASKGDTVVFFELNNAGNITQSYKFTNIILADAKELERQKNLIKTRDTVTYGEWSSTPIMAKWGYMTEKGKLKVPFKHDYAHMVPRSDFVITSRRRKKPLDPAKLLDDEYTITHNKGLFDDDGKRYEKPRHWQVFAHELGLDSVDYVRLLGFDGKFTINSSARLKTRGKKYTFIGDNVDGLAPFNVGGEYYITPDAQDPYIICNRYWFKRYIGTLDTNDHYPVKYHTEYVAIKGGTWGYLNRQGKEVLDGLTYASDVYRKIGMIRTGDTWGLVSSVSYLNARHTDYLSVALQKAGNSHIYTIRSQDLVYGFVNAKKQYPVDPKLQMAEPFSERRALVMRNDRWYFINAKGQEYPNSYRTASQFTHGLAAVKHRYKFNFIDTTGAVAIDQEYYAALPFAHPKVTWVKQGKFWELINKNGETIKKGRFSSVKPFIGDLAIATTPRRKYRLVHASGHFINAKRYSYILNVSNGMVVAKKGAKYHLLDANSGKSIVNQRFDYMTAISDGKVIAKRKSSWWLIDSTGNRYALEYGVQRAGQFSENLCAVKIRGQWGYINSTGQVVLQPQYTAAKAFLVGRAEVTFANGTKGFINVHGDTLFTFEGVVTHRAKNDQYIIIRHQNHSGFYNYSGQLLFGRKYHDARAFEGGEAPVQMGHYWTLINRNGTALLPAIYNEIFEKSHGYWRYNIKGKMGVSIIPGQELIPTLYDEITLLHEDVVQAKIGHKINYYLLNRGWIWIDDDTSGEWGAAMRKK